MQGVQMYYVNLRVCIAATLHGFAEHGNFRSRFLTSKKQSLL